MANIKAFSFYKSYHEALKDLPVEERKNMLLAIDEFVFENINPKFKGIEKTIWTLIEPNLTTSKNRSNKNAGAPIGNKNAEKPKENEEEAKTNKKQSNNNQIPHDILMNKSYSYINNHISNINTKNSNIIELFKEYIVIRINKKYNISETIIKRLINKLNEYGKNDKEKEEILLEAINGYWKDLYPLDEKRRKKKVDDIYERA